METQSLKRHQTEYRLHCSVVEHLRSAFPQVLFLHPANRASGDTEETRKTNAFFNQQMGVLKGAPDILCWWKGLHKDGQNKLHSGAIELKTGSGLGPYQKTFDHRFTLLGGQYAVCKSVQGVHDALKLWGLVPRHNAVREPDLRSDSEKKADGFAFYAPKK